MSYLIDTNVLSELRRSRPNPPVVAWFEQRHPAMLYLSVLTVGEIRAGIEQLQDHRRRQPLLDWLEMDLPTYFAGRLLPVDAAVADRWGRMVANAGRPLSAIDSLMAATALAHDLRLVTRNVKHFANLGVDLINPWSSG